MFEAQYEQMEAELRVLVKYKLIKVKDEASTRAQYKKLFFHDGYAYLKEYLITPTEVRKKNIEKIYLNQELERASQPEQTPVPVPASIKSETKTKSVQPDTQQKKFVIPTEDTDDDPFDVKDDLLRSLKNDTLPA